MKTAVTLARRHDEEVFRVLSDPSTPVEEQKAEFKRLKASQVHSEYAEVQLWSSDGLRVKRRFDSPAASNAEDTERKAREDGDRQKTEAETNARAAKAKAAADAKAARAKARQK